MWILLIKLQIFCNFSKLYIPSSSLGAPTDSSQESSTQVNIITTHQQDRLCLLLYTLIWFPYAWHPNNWPWYCLTLAKYVSLRLPSLLLGNLQPTQSIFKSHHPRLHALCFFSFLFTRCSYTFISLFMPQDKALHFHGLSLGLSLN